MTSPRGVRGARKFHEARAPSARGQQRGVGVQQRGVGGVGHRAEHLALRRRSARPAWPAPGRGGWRRRRRRSVVTSPLPSVTSTPSAVSSTEVTLAPVRTSGRPAATLATYCLRAAGDGAPLRAAEDAEHAVVLQEREEVARGVVERDLGVARPHGGHERLHEVAREVRREAALGEELAQRRGRGPRRRRQERAGPAVEARDLGEHPQVARVAQVRRRREQARGGRARRPTRGRSRRRGSTSTSRTAGWPRRARRRAAAAPGRCAGCAR